MELEMIAAREREALAESLARIALHAVSKGGVIIPWDSRCAKEIERAIASYLQVAADEIDAIWKWMQKWADAAVLGGVEKYATCLSYDQVCALLSLKDAARAVPREPTKDMRKAGVRALGIATNDNGEIAREVWISMLDAAIAERKPVPSQQREQG